MLAALLLVLPVTGFAQTAAIPPAAATDALPQRDFSPLSMFLHADLVVKVVMVGLAFASVMTWTVLITKGLELAHATRAQRHALRAVDQAHSLGDATKQLNGSPSSILVAAAEEELRLSAAGLGDPGGRHEGNISRLEDRIGSRLERLEAAIGRRIVRGTGLLATIGATAPFVGLFGTVWGIMNSFIGISRAQTTNLAIVAPGIAEALLATACGLVAAIPAVVIYNHFVRQTATYRAIVADTSAAVLRLVSRDLSAGARPEVELHAVAE
ncbi:tonB-system energizer ExbB [Nitrospirillum sp. BR 11163]|uniref:tonB-system energizer ExbB n=1 Tax=Nitrospirillum sp. BR 11163 TaxID=3104323 RepID=UPI002AFF3A37|nr:tonB-system energizer ExbB [Nitrospirillum sp. BR 11163]MEA1672872.1 tonB-system energizer ExbB [Nitrospirillum sp. BR 11163]